MALRSRQRQVGYITFWILPVLILTPFSHNFAFIYILFSIETCFFLYVLIEKKYKFALIFSTIVSFTTFLTIYGFELHALLERIKPTYYSVGWLQSTILPSEIANIILRSTSLLINLNPMYPRTDFWQLALLLLLTPFFIAIIVLPFFSLNNKLSFLGRIIQYFKVLATSLVVLIVGAFLILFLKYNIEERIHNALISSPHEHFSLQYSADTYLKQHKLSIAEESIILIPKITGITEFAVKNEADSSTVFARNSINRDEPIIFSLAERQVILSTERLGFFTTRIFIDIHSVMADLKICYSFPFKDRRIKKDENIAHASFRIRDPFVGTTYKLKIHLSKKLLLESIPKYSESYLNIPSEDVYEFKGNILFNPKIQLYCIDSRFVFPRSLIKFVINPASETLITILLAILAPSAILMWFRSKILSGIRKVLKRKKHPIGF